MFRVSPDSTSRTHTTIITTSRATESVATHTSSARPRATPIFFPRDLPQTTSPILTARLAPKEASEHLSPKFL